MNYRSRLPALIAVAVAAAPAIVAPQPSGDAAVVATPHFAFHSDFATNLHHALVAAGRARTTGSAELFRVGPEKSCFDALPSAERAGWSHAVDWFAEVIAPLADMDRPAMVGRLVLAGVARPDRMRNASERRLAEIFAGFRGAAEPAYRQCAWATQDASNRAWIDNAAGRLAVHEKPIGEQLPRVFDTPWVGLPFRVDVVELGPPLGADSVIVNPPSLHALVSRSVAFTQERAALELVFHEASHFLTGRNAPLREALAAAARDREIAVPDDLTHSVHFFLSGEVTRRVLAAAGEAPYLPYVYALNLFDDRRDAIAATWSAYLDGTRTMRQAANDLIARLSESAPRAKPTISFEAQGLKITLANGSDAEQRTGTELRRVLERYDVSKWIFTNAVRIDQEAATPYSHPVLTLGTKDADIVLLAALVHEQIHWFEEAHADRKERAIEDLRRLYPEAPDGPPEGARDRYSTYLHLLVCYLEYEALKQLVGTARATQELAASTYYRWIYRTVLNDHERLRAVIERHRLTI